MLPLLPNNMILIFKLKRPDFGQLPIPQFVILNTHNFQGMNILSTCLSNNDKFPYNLLNMQIFIALSVKIATGKIGCRQFRTKLVPSSQVFRCDEQLKNSYLQIKEIQFSSILLLKHYQVNMLTLSDMGGGLHQPRPIQHLFLVGILLFL